MRTPCNICGLVGRSKQSLLFLFSIKDHAVLYSLFELLMSLSPKSEWFQFSSETGLQDAPTKKVKKRPPNTMKC